jgi:hypothetical protein
MHLKLSNECEERVDKMLIIGQIFLGMIFISRSVGWVDGNIMMSNFLLVFIVVLMILLVVPALLVLTSAISKAFNILYKSTSGDLQVKK